MSTIRNIALAGLAAAALAFGTAGSASAAWGGHHGGWRGGHYYGHGGGWGWGGAGVGFLGGLALGAATAPYWGGYYGYGPYAYDYGPDCYIRRRIVVDRHGFEHVRRVRVCY